MSSLQLQSVRTGFADFQGHQTWFRVTGDLDPDADRAPVVILHGGPGAAHNYCLAMTSLAEDGRAVVHYDQLGCGRSTAAPRAPRIQTRCTPSGRSAR